MGFLVNPSQVTIGIMLISAGACFLAALLVHIMTRPGTGSHLGYGGGRAQLDSQEITAQLLQRTPRGGVDAGRHRSVRRQPVGA